MLNLQFKGAVTLKRLQLALSVVSSFKGVVRPALQLLKWIPLVTKKCIHCKLPCILHLLHSVRLHACIAQFPATAVDMASDEPLSDISVGDKLDPPFDLKEAEIYLKIPLRLLPI